VGDDEHLVPLRHLRQGGTDRGRRGAADARVDLVEHQGRRCVRRRFVGEDEAESEHGPGELAAGGDLAER
jgi:hypothetical protein